MKTPLQVSHKSLNATERMTGNTFINLIELHVKTVKYFKSIERVQCEVACSGKKAKGLY